MSTLHKWTFKDDSGESAERKEESYKEDLNLLGEHVNNPEQTVSRNMDYKGHSDEVSDRNKEHITEIG